MHAHHSKSLIIKRFEFELKNTINYIYFIRNRCRIGMFKYYDEFCSEGSDFALIWGLKFSREI